MNETKTRIILFHANRLFRESIAFILAQQHSISVIGSAAGLPHVDQALAALNADLYILNFGGPSRAGLKDARRVRTLSSGFKILLIDVPDNEADILACIECGAAGYVLQDASVEDLITNVRAVAAGETLCSPRIASLAFCRISRLARQISESESVNVACLTKREAEIVTLIEDGLSNKEIAVRLHLEVSTVKNHVHNILDKLHLHDRRSAVQCLKEQRLITTRF